MTKKYKTKSKIKGKNESASKGFKKDEQSEYSLNCTYYDFQVDNSSIEKHIILNIIGKVYLIFVNI